MTVRIIIGDCREKLRALSAQSIHCCVTSPPYFGLRDYGVPGQIGLEQSLDDFVEKLVGVFREVHRVLRDDGTLWLNLGDSYARNPAKGTTGTPNGRNVLSMGYSGGAGIPTGLKEKDLIGVPWRVAFALQADGWYLRSSIIWHKPNPMPESVKDRPTNAYEFMFLFAKSERYFYDAEAVEEAAKDWSSGEPGTVKPTRNLRNVWTVPTQAYKGAHFATFPPALIEPCIKAGCPEGGTILDPFGGAGTTGLVSDRLGRNAVLIELNPEYAAMAEGRIRAEQLMFADVVIEVSKNLTSPLEAQFGAEAQGRTLSIAQNATRAVVTRS